MEWLRGRQTACPEGVVKLQGWDLNPRPQGYEPCELPGCSTLRSVSSILADRPRLHKPTFRRFPRTGELLHLPFAADGLHVPQPLVSDPPALPHGLRAGFRHACVAPF